MTGKRRALSFALVLIVAMSAAPAALHAGKLDIGATPAVIKGHTDPEKAFSRHIFTRAGATLTAVCGTASFEGTTQGATLEEAVITPTYGEKEDCTVFFESKVQMNGCKYTLTGAGQAANTFRVDIVGCTAGKQIKIVVAASCVYVIPEQNGLSHVVAKTGPDTGGVSDITMEVTLTGITYKKEGGGPCSPAEGTDGALEGSTVAQAYQDAGSLVVNRHGHTYSELLTGTKVSLATT